MRDRKPAARLRRRAAALLQPTAQGECAMGACGSICKCHLRVTVARRKMESAPSAAAKFFVIEKRETRSSNKQHEPAATAVHVNSAASHDALPQGIRFAQQK
jgi:hypothetical protein